MKKIIFVIMVAFMLVSCNENDIEVVNGGDLQPHVKINDITGLYSINLFKDRSYFISSNENKAICEATGDFTDKFKFEMDNIVYTLRSSISVKKDTFKESKESEDLRDEITKEWADNIEILSGDVPTRRRRKKFSETLGKSGMYEVYKVSPVEAAAKLMIYEISRTTSLKFKHDSINTIEFKPNNEELKKVFTEFYGDQLFEEAKKERIETEKRWDKERRAKLYTSHKSKKDINNTKENLYYDYKKYEITGLNENLHGMFEIYNMDYGFTVLEKVKELLNKNIDKADKSLASIKEAYKGKSKTIYNKVGLNKYDDFEMLRIQKVTIENSSVYLYVYCDGRMNYKGLIQDVDFDVVKDKLKEDIRFEKSEHTSAFDKIFGIIEKDININRSEVK